MTATAVRGTSTATTMRSGTGAATTAVRARAAAVRSRAWSWTGGQTGTAKAWPGRTDKGRARGDGTRAKPGAIPTAAHANDNPGASRGRGRPWAGCTGRDGNPDQDSYQE